MNPKVLSWLACPLCGADFSLGDGLLACASGHGFPVVRGVPRLLPQNEGEAGSIRASFSREWSHFDYQTDRTWAQTVDQRREDFLRHVDLPAEALAGKLVLDAGCGNGTLSEAVSSFGCDVLAADVSESVEAAHAQLGAEEGRTHFVQADLMRPPFRPGRFDVVFCAGVLHHTPSTRRTFGRVAAAVAPGGTMFVWLYWKVPGAVLRLKSLLRRLIAPLPAPLKHAIVVVGVLPQAMLRQRLRELTGRLEPGDRLSWRERLVVLLDSYTPRYRWEHTPEEVHGWYRELGFTEIKTTEGGRWGFGVAARKPA